MSGGNKKKAPKTQGWEEAGAEFYQESYPTDAEVELPRDPKHLATLLPSKQNRAVATTIRVRTNDNRTIRRQTSTRSRSRSRRESTVHRRMSTTGDVQVSMLPDLSENLSNEQTTWEEIMLIKTMPVPMSQKKEMKTKILNEPNLRLQGYEQFKWKRRKMWRQLRSRLGETWSKLELWKGNLKTIEGNYGTGVVSYFQFVKWLFYLNIFIFTLNFLFIILPTILIHNPTNDEYCTSDNVNNNNSAGQIILDLIQGTGFMRCSVLFYGFYPNETFVHNDSFYYNLPIAYIFVNLFIFLATLLAIVRSAAKGFKDRLVEGEGQFYLYCNLIFGGWDFCIHNQKTANIKHKAIYNEIKACLEARKMEETRQNRTRNERVRLFLIRIVVNILTICVLIGCGCAIYFIFDFSTEQIAQLENCVGLEKIAIEDNCDKSVFHELVYEFLPSITIVALNILVPFSFRYLIRFEHYSPQFVVRLTLFRTIFLRLSALVVLCASLYRKITKGGEFYSDCWETYAGQHIYKLVLTDFATQIVITFFINFPRAILARHINNKFVKVLGQQSFDLPRHVLDVVYSQTLCFLGVFYAPLLSLIFSLLFFIIFYIKKFACLVNCQPSEIIYRVSRSKSMFMVILLLSFIFALIPFAYSISELKPSENCGPFQNLPSVWWRVVETFMTAPKWLQDAIFFLNTAGFAIPIFIILILLLYYYTAINSANRHMVNVLKNQLVLEGHDKQFLLERLSKFIKHQQENQKRMRRVEVLSSGDTQVSN